MPKVGLTETFELKTREFSKVDCQIAINVNGRELPSMAVMGAALEEAIKLFQDKITESYKMVPERV